MIRVLATGDLHIEQGARWDECRRVLRWIALQVEAVRPAFVIIPGDVFDKASTAAERLFAAEIVIAMARVCAVVIVKGNHEGKLELSMLALLESSFPIHVVETAAVLDIEGVAVACMAWPTMAGSIDDGSARDGLQAVLRGLGAELASRPAAAPKILAGHWMIDGSKTSAGQPLIGSAVNVSLSDLALAGADVVVAGHIHKAQTFQYGETPILYTGSPYRTAFGEAEEKSILSLTFEAGVVTVDRIPTPARPMIQIDAAFRSGSLVDVESGEILPGDVDVRDADVRVTYAVAADARELGRRAYKDVEAAWLAAGAATVAPDPKVEAATRARAPEVAAAKTIEEKLCALWVSRSETPPPERVLRLMHRVSVLQEQRTEAA